MEYSKYRDTIVKMSPEEREVTVVLYLKDIKDLLMNLVEEKGITPKHY